MRYALKLLMASLGLGISMCQSAGADEIVLGAGGSYSQVAIANSAGTGNAIYAGPGYGAELRYRLMPSLFSSSDFGFDFFATIDREIAPNVNASISETDTILAYGGGIDFRLVSFLFLGMQYEHADSQVSSGGTITDIPYSELAGRVGFRIPFSRSMALTLTGIAGFASAAGTGGASRSVTDFGGVAQLQFRLLELFRD